MDSTCPVQSDTALCLQFSLILKSEQLETLMRVQREFVLAEVILPINKMPKPPVAGLRMSVQQYQCAILRNADESIVPLSLTMTHGHLFGHLPSVD